MDSPVLPPKTRGLPRFLPGKAGARGTADAKKAAKPIAGIIQLGQYPDPGAISSGSGENNGDNTPFRYLLSNNYHLVRADPTLLLDSADHCGFTLSNPMALPPEPVPVDPALWRSVFPPHLPETIDKGGRWLFRGKPPDVAFARGAEEVAKRRTTTEFGPEEVIRREFLFFWPDDTPDHRQAVLACTNGVRDTVAAYADHFLQMMEGAADPVPVDVIDQIGARALELAGLDDWLPPVARRAWNDSVYSSLDAVRQALRSMEADLNGCLLTAASEWKSLPGRYRAEDETPADGENVYVLSNEKMRIVRELAAVWPIDAIWPAATWTADGRTDVEEASREGPGAEGEAMRQATIAAAAERIVTLSDDLQDYREPEEGEAPRAPSRRMRVLLGTLDEVGLASPDNVPPAARDAFRAATRRHCSRLWEEYRQAKAYRQRSELAEAEVSAARTAERDAADRAAGIAHAVGRKTA